MLVGVVEVVSSIHTVGHKNIFSAFTGVVDLLYRSIYLHIEFFFIVLYIILLFYMPYVVYMITYLILHDELSRA